jgi:GT2 family glycosyltransferase
MIDLSIIIVNWNTRDLLCQCLRSIQETADGIAYEIVVVDNGSADGSLPAVREAFPLVQLIANAENLGFARANNQGIRASRGRHVLLLNSDTLVRPGALAALVGFLEQHSDVGIVGPELLNRDGSVQLSWAAFPTLWSELSGKNIRARRRRPARDGREAYSVDWIGGACLLIRRAAIEQIGLLDERFFMYSEETDWCFRAWEQGWQVCYYTAARVVHFGGQSSRRASARMKAQLYRSKLLFMAKHYGALPAASLGLLLQLLFVSRALRAWLLSAVRVQSRPDAARCYREALEVIRVASLPPYTGRS